MSDKPLLASQLLFPDILWALPQNVYQKRGKILLVGGSPGYIKPLVEIAEVCLALRAAAVTMALPEGLADTLQSVAPDIPVVALPATPTGSLAKTGQAKIIELSGQADMTVFGPSISKQSETQQLAKDVIPPITSSLIVTDDAVETLDGQEIANRKSPTLAIFDAGSFGRLLKRSGYSGVGERPIVEHLFKEQLSVMSEQAQQWRVNLLLTSPEFSVAGTNGDVAVAPGLTPKAMGDELPLLTGLIAALGANQSAKLFECAATTLLIISKLLPERSLEALPKVVAEIEAASEQSRANR